MEQAAPHSIYRAMPTEVDSPGAHSLGSIDNLETTMKARISIAATLAALALAGCSGMTHQDKTTVGGAAVGGVAGAALTNGSALGTVGGAAVGGVVGHEVGK
jgi:osmotically inducible lipoprotein OsmB